MGFHGRQQRIEPAGVQRRHLIERAGLQHRRKARVDSRIQRAALRRQEQRGPDLVRRQQRRQRLAMPGGERLAGALQHFQRPRHPHPIGDIEPRRPFRIASRQFGMQRGDAVLLQPLPHSLADFWRDRRHGGQTARQRLKI